MTQRLRPSRDVLQALKDFLGAPLRLLVFPDDLSKRLGLTSLEEERIQAVLPYIQGNLLDIGAGRNRLVRAYGRGVGVDVYDWRGGATIVSNTAQLPFPAESFDTVTFLASLNHIPNRVEVLKETRRLLRPQGRIVITMITPILSYIGHKLWWYSEEKVRGMAPGEVYGFWPAAIRRMLQAAGFTLLTHRRFLYGLNHLYVAVKAT